MQCENSVTLMNGLDHSVKCILSSSSVPAGQNVFKFCTSYLRLWPFFQCKKSLPVCTNTIYRYIVFSDISQKCVFGHNFWTKAHKMIILVSRTMFLGSRNQMAPFVFLDLTLTLTWPWPWPWRDLIIIIIGYFKWLTCPDLDSTWP